jgi:two-component system, NarL family, sensor histidine kinase DesK
MLVRPEYPWRARLGVALGLLFLIGPLSDLLGQDISRVHRAILLAGLALFVVLYLTVVPAGGWFDRFGERGLFAALGLLAVLAVALLAGGAPTSFVALFVYFVAAAGVRLPPRTAGALVVVTGVAVATGLIVAGESDSSIAATALTVVAIGALMTAFGRVARANRELQRTQEELAQLAVSEERLRIARDLHDLLGHSLSLIALKTELARRLIDREPERAAVELDEIQSVTREALAEVRGAVQGYRRLALADALAGARSALASAGIDCDLAEPDAPLPADVDAVLAWGVREGTTNVIRHSHAHRCAIRVRTDGDRAALEIEDDGDAADGDGTGSGLDGLRERARRLRGEVEAGARAEGGFLLRLTVPLAQR